MVMIVVSSFDQINLNHLRDETYTETSRIPNAVSASSPLVDAKRRDFTVNSLFYNLISKEVGTNLDRVFKQVMKNHFEFTLFIFVEDFTGHGIPDLINKVIRTPTDPKITLNDDPLRALRAVRSLRSLSEAYELCWLSAPAFIVSPVIV